MIEKYIEKEIMRQVKIVEYIYECRKLPISDISYNLDVSYNTIKRDVDKLILALNDFISHSQITSTHISIIFYDKYTRYDLIKEIYKASNFLSVCSRYLLGDRDYINIVEEEFVSVTKAFRLKKSVESYFREIGVFDENNEWIMDELKLRLVMITVWMRCPHLYHEIDQANMEAIEIFTNQLLNDLSNHYEANNREYAFLVWSVYLSIRRHKSFPIQDTSPKISDLKNSLAFHKIKKYGNKFFNKKNLDDNEFLFITSVYKNISLNSNNYTLIQMNYQAERKNVIESNLYIRKLALMFEQEFKHNLFYNILFERPLISFSYSLWNDLQNFIVYRHYYLNKYQLSLVKRIKKILVTWRNQIYPNNSFMYNDAAIEHFTYQLASVLAFNKETKHTFFIVAENEESHTVYREILTHWINMETNIIDSTLYYSLDDVPPYISKHPSIIICERSLLFKEKQKIPHVFPISRYSIREDLKKILSELLNLIQ